MAKAYSKLIAAFVIFGSMGLFARLIPLPAAEIVLARTLVGGAGLLLVMRASGRRFDKAVLRRNVWPLLIAGAVLAGGWLALFEAYKRVPVGTATVVYYLAPVIVLFAAPFLLKEKLTAAKAVGVIAAMGGLALLCGVGLGGLDPVCGLLFALVSAIMYAALMIVNKFIKELGGIERTALQLVIAAALLLPYALLAHEGAWVLPDGAGLLALIVLCVVHTGFGCYLYFSSMQGLSAQTIAVCGYIDPLCALLFAAAFLDERLSALQWLGAALILGGALLAQLSKQKQ